MSVSLEPYVIVGGVVRSWICRSGREHQHLGDLYTTRCIIDRLPGYTAFARGLVSLDLHKGEMDELKELLRKEKFTALHYERHRKDGSIHYAVISLAR